jgi:hypothetical protein
LRLARQKVDELEKGDKVLSCGEKLNTLSSSFMPAPLLPSQRLEKLFHRRKCWMLAELAHALGYALISVRRFLNQIGYFRSYTHNGKWYPPRRTAV